MRAYPNISSRLNASGVIVASTISQSGSGQVTAHIAGCTVNTTNANNNPVSLTNALNSYISDNIFYNRDCVVSGTNNTAERNKVI